VERARLGDDELAGRAARGDERAFEELYRRYQRPLLRYCRSITGDDEDARDALQSAMLGAVRALPTRTRQSGVRAWLYAIARNESISVLRRRRPVAGEEAIDGSGAAAPSADVVAADRERAAQVVLDLGQLSARQRDAIVLRELADVSFEEIAAMHGSTPHAVRQSVTEARTALKEIAAGREASCATIRPALIDRRRRSRAVRAHLSSCRSCQAIASTSPRHAFAPFAGVAYLFKRIAASLGVGEAGQGVASTIVSSGAGKPAAAAGVALVAALATTGSTSTHHHQPEPHAAAAKPPSRHASAPKKRHTVAAAPKTAAPAAFVKTSTASARNTVIVKAAAKATTVHTVAVVDRKPVKSSTGTGPSANADQGSERPVDDGGRRSHAADPPADQPPAADDSLSSPPEQHYDGSRGQGRGPAHHYGGGDVSSARADCPTPSAAGSPEA
jgi:RNA polymerase sigma-70 factor (ECF subfamily)